MTINGTGARPLVGLLMAALLAFQTGCSSLQGTRAGEGAAIGAASGAVLGAVIGSASGSTAKGAILGAVLGGAAGTAIGARMDKQAEELVAEIDGAQVERVGEGIQVTFASGILFGFDSSELRPAARENLNKLRQSLQDYPGTDLVVIGHTDSTGDEGYNQRLSERRAESAASYMVSVGLNRARIRTQGLGESEPVADNGSEAGRTLNRRVEVAIYANEQLRAEMQARHPGS